MDGENNQYYEPTIRTARNVAKEIKINNANKFDISNFISKQKLISFLENKINLCNEDIKKLSKDYCTYFSIIKENQVMLKVFQEVLDFVNKGEN